MMSFLNNIINKQSNLAIDDWVHMTTIDQIADIIEQSVKKPAVIFKHSTTCGISAGAKYRLESGWEDLAGDVDLYYLDLLSYRPVSNEVAKQLGVVHQSPQIILLYDGKVVYDTSHHQVNAENIRQKLDMIAS